MADRNYYRTSTVWMIAITMLIGATTEGLAQAGAKVISEKKRSMTLELGEKYLHLKDPVLYEKLAELVYPFSFLPPEEEVEEVAEAPVAVNEEAPPPPPEIIMTDREVLEDVAANIKPTGTLERAGKAYLVFPKGQIPDGGTIKLNYKGKPYVIRITDVTDTGYNLILNDETTYKTLGDSGKGTVERDEK